MEAASTSDEKYNFQVKGEERETCLSAHDPSSDLLADKIMVNTLDDDFENVDIESINIDDIFDENPHDDWSELKSFSTIHMNSSPSCAADMSNISCMNSDAVTFIQPNQYHSQFDNNNKYFFITDILNKNKYWYNQERYVESKPSSHMVLNNNFVSNNFNMIKQGTDVRHSVNASESEMPYMFGTCQNITKNKAIRPLIDSSPNKKHISLKNVKSNEQLCCVCNDNATGKHYGIISCEGCKGFFKRTIRNCLTYKCRDFNNCSVDKKLRNRCQYCRFQKCLTVGMKREAVQLEKSERRRKLAKSDASDVTHPSPSSTSLPGESYEHIYSNTITQIHWENMLQIELINNPEVEEAEIIQGNVMKIISEAVNDHLFSIVYWAKYIPGFEILTLSDQTLLINMCWGELVIANFTHRSLKLKADVILLRNGSKLIREIAQQSGLGSLIDRIIFEILHRFRDLKIDRCELSYIKAIILFNPNLKNLENRSLVQMIRDKYYSSLQQYCTENYLSEKYRFNKLLLRLPSLRSVALIFLDHFRLYDIVNKSKGEQIGQVKGETNSYNFLDEMLQNSSIIFDH